jgi:carboxyl-terminal processing protease
MKKNVLRVFNFVFVGLLITSCSGVATPISTPVIPVIPTSTRPVPTPSLTFTATVAPAAKLPISVEATAYLEEALDIMQNNSLHRHSIEWEIIRTSAFEVAQHAQTPADTYGAIRYALVRLGEHHSHFLTPESHRQVQGTTANDNPPPRGKLLLDKLGFIAVEGFGGFDGETYATQIQDLIRELDGQDPCGWIVDLRENTGGNMWPMLAGLGPILGDGKAGTFVDADGQKVDWSYRDGRALLESEMLAEVNGAAYRLID